MYGYWMLLQSPDSVSTIVLQMVSWNRYASVQSLLRAQFLHKRYGDWSMLSFQTAYAPTPRSKPVLIGDQVTTPGTLIQACA